MTAAAEPVSSDDTAAPLTGGNLVDSAPPWLRLQRRDVYRIVEGSTGAPLP